MTLHGLQNISRRNLLISYRREYTAQALISLHGKEPVSCPVEFSLELTPFGSSIIRVKLLDGSDFPTIPVTTAVKELVHTMDHNGELP